MARYQIIRIDLLKSRDDLPDVLVGQRRHDVEAANDRMDLLDAGSGLCLSDCIDDAAMTAGCQHDQSLASDDEVRSDLVLKMLPVFFADETFSGKHPKPLTTPTFSRLGRSGVSKPVCAILPVVKA